MQLQALALLTAGLALTAIYFAYQVDEPHFKLYLIEDEFARCLDGTKPGFYHASGFGDGADKFLIYFQGGGWIGGKDLNETLYSALDRTKYGIGSSKNWLATGDWDKGIFTRNQEVNPNFYNWNAVHINYCDGTGHQGYKEDPISVEGKDLYFRGEANTKAIIKALQDQFGFKEAKEILLSGCSAGGLATYNWANYFRGLFSPSVKVMAAPDSGLFLDMESFDHDDKLTYRNFYFKNFMQIANVETDPVNSKCVEANPDEKWKCLMAPYLINYIDVPVFFVQSLYDQWSIPNILHTDCVWDGTLYNCTVDQLNYIEQHRANTYNIMKQALDANPTWGGWAPSCINHCYEEWDAFNSPKFNVPEQSEVTISSGLSAWTKDTNSRHSHIDDDRWPLNKACSKFHWADYY